MVLPAPFPIAILSELGLKYAILLPILIPALKFTFVLTTKKLLPVVTDVYAITMLPFTGDAFVPVNEPVNPGPFVKEEPPPPPPALLFAVFPPPPPPP